jgi:excisionase family DNA binding protein
MGVHGASPVAHGGGESIRALATVTLDARALEELAPQAVERLAELVEARIAGRRREGAQRTSGLLSVREVAAAAGVSPSLIYREVERGRLPALKVGTRLRFEPEAVARWKDTCRVRPRSEPPMYEPVTRARSRTLSGGFVDELDAIEREGGRAA